jgi:hypothetical protein
MLLIVSAYQPFNKTRLEIILNVLVNAGESIASEGSGEYLFVEGHVLATSGKPIVDASIETWETDAHGEKSDIALPLPILIVLFLFQGSTTLRKLPVTFQTAEAGCAQI